VEKTSVGQVSVPASANRASAKSFPRHCDRSEAIQQVIQQKGWIARITFRWYRPHGMGLAMTRYAGT